MSVAVADTVNARVVAQLLDAAELLMAQDADVFRVRSYRRGAESIASLQESVADVHERGGQLNRCRDWVIIYRDEPDEGQWTVVEERDV